jgi:LytS/YehU family sensor histidine kinase
MDFFGISGILVIIIPILVHQIKQIECIGNKFAPVVAFILGIIGGVAGYYLGYAPQGTDLIQAIMTGIAIGGTSTGLYDTGKKLTETKQ